MKQILERLFAQHTLTKEESRVVMHQLVEGKFPAAQLAAFLAVYRTRPITIDELQGFREALMELCLTVELGARPVIDLCGTGGDGKSSFNISTISALVVAACGVAVAKHGNYAVSSACGSSNLLEALGVKFTTDSDRLRRSIDKANICFLHAPLFHPSMKTVAPVRKEMGVKTFFNLLGPLVNPACPQVQLCGVYSLEILRLYTYLADRIGKNFTVVHSLDGFDEVSLTAPAMVVSSGSEELIRPEELGYSRIKAEELNGGKDVQSSLKIINELLDGRGSEAQRAVVAANSGVALRAAREGKCALQECIEECGEALRSGRAKAVLKACVELQDL